MKNDLIKHIENITSVVDALPTKTKANKQKYNEYIDDQIKEFNNKKDNLKEEILKRYHAIIEQNNQGDDMVKISDLDINYIRCSSPYYNSLEKMNLNYLLYELNHFYNNDLEKINNVILKVIEEFNKVGIKLETKDFIYSSEVRTYIEALLSKNANIKIIFEDIFWKTPNFIQQIELNFRYLYFKNKKTIDKYFNEHYNAKKLYEYLIKYKKSLEEAEDYKHNSIKYIFNNFINGKFLPAWVEDKNVNEFFKKYIKEENDDTYSNLNKVLDSLNEYKTYQSFSFIIDDLKGLYEKKNEYKDIYNNKLKEISKKESELFKINSKIEKQGLFKLSGNKLAEASLQKNNIIKELGNLYNELKELKIKDIIFDKVKEDTSHLDLLKLALSDFNYFVKMLKEHNENMDENHVKTQLKKIYNFAYASDVNVISNVAISEDKNIPRIISDRYRLVNIFIEEESLEGDLIKDVIHNVEDMITNLDLKRLNMNLKEIKFVLEVKDKFVEKGENNDTQDEAN